MRKEVKPAPVKGLLGEGNFLDKAVETSLTTLRNNPLNQSTINETLFFLSKNAGILNIATIEREIEHYRKRQKQAESTCADDTPAALSAYTYKAIADALTEIIADDRKARERNRRIEMGRRLKTARRAKGLTQKQLAKILGITYQAVGNFESGIREPTGEVLIGIARTMEISLDWLFGLTEE